MTNKALVLPKDPPDMSECSPPADSEEDECVLLDISGLCSTPHGLSVNGTKAERTGDNTECCEQQTNDSLLAAAGKENRESSSSKGVSDKKYLPRKYSCLEEKPSLDLPDSGALVNTTRESEDVQLKIKEDTEPTDTKILRSDLNQNNLSHPLSTASTKQGIAGLEMDTLELMETFSTAEPYGQLAQLRAKSVLVTEDPRAAREGVSALLLCTKTDPVHQTAVHSPLAEIKMAPERDLTGSPLHKALIGRSQSPQVEVFNRRRPESNDMETDKGKTKP